MYPILSTLILHKTRWHYKIMHTPLNLDHISNKNVLQKKPYFYFCKNIHNKKKDKG